MTETELKAAVERDKRIFADDLHAQAVVRAVKAERRIAELEVELADLKSTKKPMKRG